MLKEPPKGLLVKCHKLTSRVSLPLFDHASRVHSTCASLRPSHLRQLTSVRPFLRKRGDITHLFYTIVSIELCVKLK